MTSEEAQVAILNFMGGQYVERWPDAERTALLSAGTFSYKQRLDLCTFLFGNLRDAELVYVALRPQLGPEPSAHDHERRFLADLASGKYDERYHYWQVVHDVDWRCLNGRLHTARAPLCSRHARCIQAWDADCMRMRRERGRWPTLAEQDAYFGL